MAPDLGKGFTTHLQQTKDESRATGGPQYFLQDLSGPVKEFLRRRGACKVVLQTPYGIAASPFMAVGWDHKLEAGKPVPGKVGHDRIQQSGGEHSIGEAIRDWYGLKAGRDFERIDGDIRIHDEGHFVLVPTAVKMRGVNREEALEKVYAPLSFHRHYESKLWREQIEASRRLCQDGVEWAARQIRRVVEDNGQADATHILESDLLRTAGASSVLGLELGPYRGRGYDCLKSCFKFLAYPSYPCPVEIKKRSSGLKYQFAHYTKLPRAVVLCMEHDFKGQPEDIDFVELPVLARYLST